MYKSKPSFSLSTAVYLCTLPSTYTLQTGFEPLKAEGAPGGHTAQGERDIYYIKVVLDPRGRLYYSNSSCISMYILCV